MRKLTTILATVFTAATTLWSCGNKASDNTDSAADTPRAIVAYFSATGTTRAAAERIARAAIADIYEIEPVELYSDSDLNWRDSLSRSYTEMYDLTSRPAITGDGRIDSIGNYDIVYVGYPNWWNMAPTIIYTFIEANDLQGKKIVPFMTSGGNTIDNSVALLRATYPTLDIDNGALINDMSDDDIAEWVATIGK